MISLSQAMLDKPSGTHMGEVSDDTLYHNDAGFEEQPDHQHEESVGGGGGEEEEEEEEGECEEESIRLPPGEDDPDPNPDSDADPDSPGRARAASYRTEAEASPEGKGIYESVGTTHDPASSELPRLTPIKTASVTAAGGGRGTSYAASSSLRWRKKSGRVADRGRLSLSVADVTSHQRESAAEMMHLKRMQKLKEKQDEQEEARDNLEKARRERKVMEEEKANKRAERIKESKIAHVSRANMRSSKAEAEKEWVRSSISTNSREHAATKVHTEDAKHHKRAQLNLEREQRLLEARHEKALALKRAEADRQELRDANAAALAQQRRDAAVKSRARANTKETHHPKDAAKPAVPRNRAASHRADRASISARHTAELAYERNKERSEKEEYYRVQRQARTDAQRLQQEERKRELDEKRRLAQIDEEERRAKKQAEVEERRRDILERRRLKQLQQMEERAHTMDKVDVQARRSKSVSHHPHDGGGNGGSDKPSFASRKSFAAVF